MLNIIAIRLLIAFTCRDTQVKNPMYALSV